MFIFFFSFNIQVNINSCHGKNTRYILEEEEKKQDQTNKNIQKDDITKNKIPSPPPPYLPLCDIRETDGYTLSPPL